MGKVSTREAADISVKVRRDMIKLMEDGDQFVTQSSVEKPGDHEINDIENFPPLMVKFGHCAAKSGTPAPYRLNDAAFRKSQGVNLGKNPVRRPAASGVNADKQPGRVYMRKRLMSCRYIGYEAFQFCCQIEGCHPDYLTGEKPAAFYYFCCL